jgi:hypothetical protein
MKIMALKVVLVKKNGNQTEEMYPATTDDKIVITSDSEKIPDNISSLEDLINALGSLAFEDYVALNVSDESNYGVVKISNTDSTATDTVPTSSYVHNELGGKVSTTGNQSISGVKSFTDGIQIAGQPLTYDADTDTIIIGSYPTQESDESES